MAILHREPDFHADLAFQDGAVYLKTTVDDPHILEKTQQLRDSGLVVPGRNAAPLQPDGARIIWWFQVHPVSWKRHKRKYPHLHKALHSHAQVEREKAAAEIARQHPEWVVTAPKELRRAPACPANPPPSDA